MISDLQHRYQPLLDAMPHGAAVVALDGTIAAANSAWLSGSAWSLGRSEPLALGENFLALLDGQAGRAAAELAAGIRDVASGALQQFADEADEQENAVEIGRAFAVAVRPFDADTDADAGRSLLCTRQETTPIHEADAARREIEARFQQLSDHLHEVFWVYDFHQRRVIFASAAYETVFGRPLHELYTQPQLWLMSVHRDDWRRVNEVLRDSNDTAFDFSYRIVRPDGAVRWVRDRGFPVFDEQGEVIRRVGILEDVTDARETEANLRHSEKRYRAAAEGGLDSFYLFDAIRDDFGLIVDFELIDCNTRACERLGHIRHTAVGERLSQFGDDQLLTDSFGKYVRVVQTREVVAQEIQIDADDEVADPAWFHLQVVPVDDGIAVTCRDITQRKTSEQTIERQRAEMQLILDSMPLLVFYKDTDNRVIRVNRALSDVLGLSPGPIADDQLASLIPSAPEHLAIEAQVMRTGQPRLGLEEQMVGRDGKVRWLRSNKVPVFDEEGEVAGIVGICEEITELYEANRRLRESEQRFRSLFNRLPIAVWEQDLSEVGTWLEELRRQGVSDLEAHLEAHPALIHQAVDLTQYRSVNQATYELYGAGDFDELMAAVRSERLTPLTLPIRDKLLGVWNHQPVTEFEMRQRKLDGTPLDVLVRTTIPLEEGRLDLSRVIVVVSDITERRRRLFEQAIVEQAQEERRLIGHELHDTLGQQITGIHMLAQTLRRKLEARGAEEAPRLAELVGLIHEANDGVRWMISGLTPEPIRAEALETAMESLAQSCTTRYEVPTVFVCPRSPKVLRNDVATHLLFIAQEAAHNAAKHAAPSRIEIELKQGSNELTLLIRNDGKPFKLPGSTDGRPRAVGGRGMQIMQYRADAIGATLEAAHEPPWAAIVRCHLRQGKKP